MPAKLYAVHGSHPCAAVARALDLKGLAYRTVEIPPPFHVPLQRLRFGRRTVPGLTLEGGEKLSGSTAIMRRLDELAPEPPLFGDARVAEAEAWGESVIQPLARRLLWRGFALNHRAMHGYQEGGRLPPLPRPVVLALAPIVTRLEARMNAVSDAAVRADVRALPAHLDRVDAWIAEGVLGGATPNAADLQIVSSLALIQTVGDVRPMFAGRPAADLVARLFPDHPGEVPAGTFPADWAS
jgi:glutathione S-transferase